VKNVINKTVFKIPDITIAAGSGVQHPNAFHTDVTNSVAQ
jgi:hypothetical protein